MFAAAVDLFYREGIRAVGVDAVARQAGVAKISLYRCFSSKEELVVAYLEQRRADYWQQWDDLVARHDGDPRGQLRAIFGYLVARTTQPRYRGCPFLNCAIEFPDPASPAHQLAVAVKREVVHRLTRMAEAIGARSPAQLADGLVLLIEGAYAISQTLGGRTSPAHVMTWAADALIDAQLTAGAAPLSP